jgi:hypothetical protein
VVKGLRPAAGAASVPVASDEGRDDVEATTNFLLDSTFFDKGALDSSGRRIMNGDWRKLVEVAKVSGVAVVAATVYLGTLAWLAHKDVEHELRKDELKAAHQAERRAIEERRGRELART